MTWSIRSCPQLQGGLDAGCPSAFWTTLQTRADPTKFQDWNVS